MAGRGRGRKEALQPSLVACDWRWMDGWSPRVEGGRGSAILTFVEVAERRQRDQRKADLLGPQTSPGRRTGRGGLWHFLVFVTRWVVGLDGPGLPCHGQSLLGSYDF